MGFERLLYQREHKKFDASAPGLRNQSPLVDFNLKLLDKNRRSIEVSGTVPNNTDFLEAVRSAVEQNGGIVITNKEGTYIEKIIFPDINFTVEMAQFYREGGLPFRMKDGKPVWSSLKESFVNGNTTAVMSDDREYTQDMPDIVPKKGGGGCGGAKEEGEILTDPTLKFADPDTEFIYNPNSGKISRSPDGSRPEEFGFLPDDIYFQKQLYYDSPGALLRNLHDAGITQLQEWQPSGSGRTDLATAQNQDWNDALLREMLQAHERIGAIFMGYSEAFLNSNATRALSPDMHTYKEAASPAEMKGQPAYVPEESQLLRLLMNPVERRIWGKLYGLPDEEQGAKAEHSMAPLRVEAAEPWIGRDSKDGGEYGKPPDCGMGMKIRVASSKPEEYVSKDGKRAGEERGMEYHAAPLKAGVMKARIPADEKDSGSHGKPPASGTGMRTGVRNRDGRVKLKNVDSAVKPPVDAISEKHGRNAARAPSALSGKKPASVWQAMKEPERKKPAASIQKHAPKELRRKTEAKKPQSRQENRDVVRENRLPKGRDSERKQDNARASHPRKKISHAPGRNKNASFAYAQLLPAFTSRKAGTRSRRRD